MLVGVFLVGGIVLVGVVSTAQTSSGRAVSGDEQRMDLLRRLERGVKTTWAMTTRFHRDTPAGPLDANLEQINRQPDWLTAGFGSVRGVWNGRSIDCTDAPGGKLCGPGSSVEPTAGARASLAALRTSTGRRGTDRVRRDGSMRAAGRRARCFSVLPRRHRTGPGTVTEYCLTTDGIPLRVGVKRSDSSDTAIARAVRTRVTDADFTRLLRGYPISSAR